MVQTVMNFLYIGTFADVDDSETDWLAENAASLLGTHDAIGIVPVTADDANGDGLIYDDESGTTEGLTYDVGGGPVSTLTDSSMLFNTTVLLGDGSTQNLQLLVIQTQTGDVFVRDTTAGASLDNLNIQSITFDSVANANGSGFYTSESIEGANVVCFAAGTLIETPQGPRAVEDIQRGDDVCTLDADAQTVRWTGSWQRERAGRNAYIVIAPDALGPGVPARCLRLSPQHRVLVRSRVAARMFDTPEVFVAARKLLPMQGVTQAPPDTPVRYHHFACSRHHVIRAESAQVETLLPGPEAIRTLRPDQAAALIKALGTGVQNGDRTRPARHCPSPRRQKLLIARLVKNRRDLFENANTGLADQPCTLV